MSTQTPNLNLVLPVGAENVSRQIVNDNNTKIDTFAGTTNSAITTINDKLTLSQVTNLQVIEDSGHNLFILRGNYTGTGNYLQLIANGNTKQLQIAKSVSGVETAVATFVDASTLDGIKIKKIPINDTTDQYGNIEVDNTTGSQGVFLFRNAFNDGVTGSFGVVNLESITSTKLTFKFRTLKDGSVLASKAINMSVIVGFD
jgi:hypothetical protein